jgi:hypothetical protein
MRANDAATAPYPVQSSSGPHGNPRNDGSRPSGDMKALGTGEIS